MLVFSPSVTATAAPPPSSEGGFLRFGPRTCGFTEEWIDTEDLEKVAASKKAKR